MNYIWEAVILAKQKGIATETLSYGVEEPFSPYKELNLECINEKELPEKILINPYYRYFEIFKLLLAPDMPLSKEVIEVCHNIAVHHLADIDVLMGMNRREYHICFLVRELEEGIFGTVVQEKLWAFSEEEKKIVANGILQLYETGESLYLLQETVKRLFPQAYIFLAEEKDEIVFFLRTEQTEEKQNKIDVLKVLFLPLKCYVELYWTRMFGVLGVPELMVQGKLVQY